jgi:hypothetical protein
VREGKAYERVEMRSPPFLRELVNCIRDWTRILKSVCMPVCTNDIGWSPISLSISEDRSCQADEWRREGGKKCGISGRMLAKYLEGRCSDD